MRKSSHASPEIEHGANVVVIPYRMLHGWRIIFSQTKIAFQVNFKINALASAYPTPPFFKKQPPSKMSHIIKPNLYTSRTQLTSKLKSPTSRIAAIKCKLSVQLHSKIDRISFEWLKAKTRLRLQCIWHRLPCKRNFPIHFRFFSSFSALFCVRKAKIYTGESNLITFLRILLSYFPKIKKKKNYVTEFRKRNDIILLRSGYSQK